MTNRIKRGGALSASQSAGAILAAFGAVATQSAMAAVDLSGSVSVGGQYDTNARQLASGESSPASADGSVARDDIALFATASVAASTGNQGPLRAQAQVNYTHSESTRQESLSHDDYSFGASMDWRPGQLFDMSLTGSQNRLPLGLADIGGLASVPQTTRSVQATFRLRPTPRWQLSLAPGWNETKTSVEGAESRRLRTNSAGASIEFLGTGRLVPGVSANQSESSYSGVDGATRYKEQGLYGTLTYQFTEVTALALSAGQTSRTTRLRAPSDDPTAAANEGKTSAFAGSLSFSSRLTAKTSISLSVFRGFQLYDGGVNTSIGTGFSAGVNWAATPKISASLTAAHSWSTIENVPLGGVRVERKDLVRSYSLGTSYLASRLVSISANVTRAIRNSQIGSDQFNSTTAGLSLSVRFD